MCRGCAMSREAQNVFSYLARQRCRNKARGAERAAFSLLQASSPIWSSCVYMVGRTPMDGVVRAIALDATPMSYRILRDNYVEAPSFVTLPFPNDRRHTALRGHLWKAKRRQRDASPATAVMSFPSRGLPSSHLRQTSVSGALGGSTTGQSLQARVNEKKIELENLKQLRDLSGAVASQMEALEQKLSTLSDGTEGMPC